MRKTKNDNETSKIEKDNKMKAKKESQNENARQKRIIEELENKI